MSERLEEGTELTLDYEKLRKVGASAQSVIPAAVQDADSMEVLVIGYVNREALEHSLDQGIATFWSTSRDELWIKGKTSGDTLELVDVRVNCEQNSLLYLVRLQGEGSCHTKGDDGRFRKSCYYRRIVDGGLEPVA